MSTRSKDSWIDICQLNCRSISTDRKIIEFDEAIQKIRFDVIGLSETWKSGSGQEHLRKSGHTLFYSGGQYKQSGTGFIVAQHMVQHVEAFTPINDRCCVLDLQIKGWSLRLVAVYGPTSAASDEDYEDFLSGVLQACNPPVKSLSRNGRLVGRITRREAVPG